MPQAVRPEGSVTQGCGNTLFLSPPITTHCPPCAVVWVREVGCQGVPLQQPHPCLHSEKEIVNSDKYESRVRSGETICSQDKSGQSSARGHLDHQSFDRPSAAAMHEDRMTRQKHYVTNPHILGEQTQDLGASLNISLCTQNLHYMDEACRASIVLYK